MWMNFVHYMDDFHPRAPSFAQTPAALSVQNPQASPAHHHRASRRGPECMSRGQRTKSGRLPLPYSTQSRGRVR